MQFFGGSMTAAGQTDSASINKTQSGGNALPNRRGEPAQQLMLQKESTNGHGGHTPLEHHLGCDDEQIGPKYCRRARGDPFLHTYCASLKETGSCRNTKLLGYRGLKCHSRELKGSRLLWQLGMDNFTDLPSNTKI
ncbi:hypothetical protein MHYP_G00122010 [Metynnis hypsauchen]